MGTFHLLRTEKDYKSLSWESVKDVLSLHDYKRIYSGILIETIKYAGKTSTCNEDNSKVLEDVFRTFKMETGDIVEIERKDETNFYYRNNKEWV